MRIEVNVVGIPAPQGSLSRGFGQKMFYSNAERLKLWRHMIISELIEATPPKWDIDSPIAVTAEFRFTRPSSHFKASGGLTKRAPELKTTYPDLDKLGRSVGDSIEQAKVVRNDSQIIGWKMNKRWATSDEHPGVYILITPVAIP